IVNERFLIGTPASPGVAIGAAWRLSETIERGGDPVPPDRREHERETAVAALADAAAALVALASRLSPEEAEIVDTGALMAQDPALVGAVEEAIIARGLTAA